MKYECDIEISADLGNVLPPVGDMMDRVNSHLAMDGYEEKLSVRSRITTMALTTEHELTDDEKEKVKTVITEQFNAAHPAWKAKVESFRRKSGNVQQSVS